MYFFTSKKTGFTLIELMVVISIIGLLSTIVYASFGEARMQARDKVRQTALKELQLSIELYKAQTGSYPLSGCSAGNNFAGPGPVQGSSNLTSCTGPINQYILTLVPDFIPALPLDPKFENQNNRGFYYRSNGTSYKLILLDVAETLRVTGYGDEFARCPTQSGSGACRDATPPATTYAVYSAGAEDW